jgi:hypothetical protein|nr:MAG TPA: hypothetical protein [Microviridae sp.]
MTKIIVQHFVENLLKVLKVLKTRTALTMNGLAELRIRSARQGAKALSKQRSKTGLQEKVTILLQNSKIIEKPIDKEYNKVRGRKVFRMTLKSYKIEMTNKETGKREIRHTLAESKKLAKCLIWTKKDIISQWKINKIEEG